MEKEEFWKTRSEGYNNLEWVKDDKYLRAFIDAGRFSREDIVLDVGTGTGIITHAIAPLVKEVIGLDESQDMLSKYNWTGNKYFVRRDIRNPLFTASVFDKITARMVFHHILEDTQAAMDECYKVLKKDGLMILAEGVPPCKGAKKHYEKVFALKEKRLIFFEEDLVKLMEKAGFKDIEVKILTLPLSVKNWLEHSGLPAHIRDRIFWRYHTAQHDIKEAYHMQITADDVIIQTKNVIVVGKK